MLRFARYATLITAASAGAMPTQAATVATFRLVATIPVSCEIDPNGAFLQDGRVVLTVRRSCNTSHSVHITGDFAGAPADLVVRYGGQQVSASGGDAWLPQAERYYNGIDQLVVESPSAKSDEFIRIAQSIQVSIDVD